MLCATGIIFKKLSPAATTSRLLPALSFLNLQVHCNWIHVEIFNSLGLEFYAWCYILIDLDSSACPYPVISAPFAKDAFFFPLYNFGCFIKNQVCIGVLDCVLVFKLIPFIQLSDFISTPCCFYYYNRAQIHKGDNSESTGFFSDILSFSICS